MTFGGLLKHLLGIADDNAPADTAASIPGAINDNYGRPNPDVPNFGGNNSLPLTASAAMPDTSGGLGNFDPLGVTSGPQPLIQQAANQAPATPATPVHPTAQTVPSTKGTILQMLLSAGIGAAAGAGQRTMAQGFASGVNAIGNINQQRMEQENHQKQLENAALDQQIKQAEIKNIPVKEAQTQANLEHTQALTDYLTGRNQKATDNLLFDKTGNPIGYRDAKGNYYSTDDLTKSTDPQQQTIGKILSDAQGKGTPQNEVTLAIAAANGDKAAGQALQILQNSKKATGDGFEKYYQQKVATGMPDTPANRLAETATYAKAKQPFGQQSITLRQDAADRADDKATKKDIDTHDKAYVQPAENIEKSYQMMNGAYNEYKAAQAAGKELPTGAQSMLALSSHLATTFGNVKGARITKDMIQEHLGARSVSDDALVAIQKFTNGDRLSPAQWDAFHNLIGQSRQLTWQTAAKEADRKHIPVDFLPPDMANVSHVPGQATAPAEHPFFSQFGGKPR